MVDEFTTDGYQRHNRCRQEHLSSLNLGVYGKTVLELGAGVGDHTAFFLDRGCEVLCVEGRMENAARLRARHGLPVLVADLNSFGFPLPKAQVVYAYGILYHLEKPNVALAQWAAACEELLLLETCVDRSERSFVRSVSESVLTPTGSITGTGCRPTRLWVWKRLKAYFPHVYLPLTQPDHEEFPLRWPVSDGRSGLIRSVFVASRRPLDNPLLSDELLQEQERLHREVARD